MDDHKLPRKSVDINGHFYEYANTSRYTMPMLIYAVK